VISCEVSGRLPQFKKIHRGEDDALYACRTMQQCACNVAKERLVGRTGCDSARRALIRDSSHYVYSIEQRRPIHLEVAMALPPMAAVGCRSPKTFFVLAWQSDRMRYYLWINIHDEMRRECECVCCQISRTNGRQDPKCGWRAFGAIIFLRASRNRLL